MAPGHISAVWKSQILTRSGSRVDFEYTNEYAFFGGLKMAQNGVFLHVFGRNSLSTRSYALKLVPETCQHPCGCCGGVRRGQKSYTAVKSLSRMSRNSKYSRWKVVFGPNSASRKSYALKLLPETCPHLCGCCGGVRPGQMWYMAVKSLRIQKYSRWKAVEKPFSISRGLQRQN